MTCTCHRRAIRAEPRRWYFSSGVLRESQGHRGTGAHGCKACEKSLGM